MAARGGDEEDRYGPVDEIAYYIGTSRQRTRPVGGKLANALGLFDMYGNVAEWVYDRYDQDYGFFGEADEAVEDPIGGEFSTQHTRSLRGGAWDTGLATCRAAFRWKQFATYHDHNLGLRVVRNLTR
jgi:formylglycine-generating enzyme required for sulfatase activity